MRAYKIPSTKISRLFFRQKDFRGGTETLINPARLSPKFAYESTNLLQVQDGVWQTRPGTGYYGEAIPDVSSIDGATEFIKSDGTREIIAIAGGYAWKSVGGGSWTQLTGATFTAGYVPYFLQINDKLYISNGVDDLAYYDGTNLNVYSAISAPTGLFGTLGSGLSSGSNDNYYRVVAVNDVGMTTPSASVNVTTNKHRDYWDKSSNEYVTLSWTAVTGANGYQIYWGESDGNEVLIGTSSTNSFTDYGEAVNPKNVYVETPDDNTTGAPKFRSMTVSGSRIWGTYDPNNKYRVYWSGTGQYLGFFSPFYGGGYVDIEKGGKNKPYAVVHYRTGKGDPITTVLCSSNDGNGVVYQVQLITMTVGSTSLLVPATYKIVGSIGTDAPRGITAVDDNIFFINKRGVYALRNKEQMFNVLSTSNLITPIRDKWESLNFGNVDNFVAFYSYPYVYFSVSEGDENDKTVIFDVERNNWNWAWNIGFKQLFNYTYGDKTKLLAVPNSGNQLIEISYNYTTDLGEPFYQSYISPMIPVNDDYTMLAKLKEIIVELGKLQGTVTIEVLGTTKDKQISTVVTKQISSTTGTTGIGDDLFSDFLFSDTNNVPKVFTQDSTKKAVRVGKKLYNFQIKVYTTNANTFFQLLGLQAKGYLLPSRSPSSWRN